MPSRASKWVFVPVLCSLAWAQDGQWVRPSGHADPLIWGRRDGLIFGLPSPGGLAGPRGLIRVGVFSPQTGRPDVLNFIAIEPVVIGAESRYSRMGFSELEPSRLDPGKNGKRLWVAGQGDPAGLLETLPARPGPVEKLSVRIEGAFENFEVRQRYRAGQAFVYGISKSEPWQFEPPVPRLPRAPVEQAP